MGWLLPLAVGAATGVLSGFGVGGGTLLLVYLTAVAGADQHLAQGINLLYFLPAGLLALPAHIKNGYVEKKALLPCITAACCESYSAAFSSSLACGSCWAGARGRKKVNREPNPSREATSNQPPWRRTIHRAMASPRPVPPVRRSRERSVR